MNKKKEKELLNQLQRGWDSYSRPLPNISPLASEELEQVYHLKVVPSSSTRTDCHSAQWHTLFMTLVFSSPLVVMSAIALLNALPAPDGYAMNLLAARADVVTSISQMLQIV